MSVQSNGTARRAVVRGGLSPTEKYEIWLALMRGEETIAQAADRASLKQTLPYLISPTIAA